MDIRRRLLRSRLWVWGMCFISDLHGCDRERLEHDLVNGMEMEYKEEYSGHERKPGGRWMIDRLYCRYICSMLYA